MTSLGRHRASLAPNPQGGSICLRVCTEQRGRHHHHSSAVCCALNTRSEETRVPFCAAPVAFGFTHLTDEISFSVLGVRGLASLMPRAVLLGQEVGALKTVGCCCAAAAAHGSNRSLSKFPIGFKARSLCIRVTRQSKLLQRLTRLR